MPCWQPQHMLIWKTEKEKTELNHAVRWDWSLSLIKDVFINWVWRTHYLALSHPYSSARHIKATSEITRSLSAQKTVEAWAVVEWDWKLGRKQGQVYLQATRMQQFTALLWAARWIQFFMWIFDNKWNLGSSWAWKWGSILLSSTCILLPHALWSWYSAKYYKTNTNYSTWLSCHGLQGPKCQNPNPLSFHAQVCLWEMVSLGQHTASYKRALGNVVWSSLQGILAFLLSSSQL